MDLSQIQVKKGILLSVGISILAIITVISFTRDDFSLQVFTHIDINYLLLALIITFLFWLIKSLKLRLLVRSLGGSVPLLKIFNIYLASAFIAHVTPSSSGGLPFIIYFIHREGLPVGKSTALTVIDSIFNLLFYLIVAPLLLVAWGEYMRFGPQITKLFYLALFLVTGFILLIIFLIFNSHLAISFLDWLVSLSFVKKIIGEEICVHIKAYVQKEINYFNEGLEILIQKKKELFMVILYTILYWLVYLMLPPVLLRGLGARIEIVPVILAQLVFNFIYPLIPTPGGSGGAELGIAYLFKFMVPNYILGIFVALWRFFSFYLSLIVGGILFVRLMGKTGMFVNE